MGQIILKNIEFTLDAKSIDKAIKEVNDLKNVLSVALSKLAERLTEDGQEMVRMTIAEMDAVDTGYMMADSIIGHYGPETHTGVIYSDAPYAIYVEFGTGYVGAVSEKHPMHDTVGWEHDINSHGPEGWWYESGRGWWTPKKGRYAGKTMAWTAGMPARPFMYETLRELEIKAEKEGGRIIAEYIP